METQLTDKQLVGMAFMLVSQIIGVFSLVGLLRQLAIYLENKEDRNE